MIEKYFNGVIEQGYDKVGKSGKNIVMACYNNDFSISGLESTRRYSREENNVFFSWMEYSQDKIVGAYDPFLDVIIEMYREYVKEDFNDFLTKCEVYEPHREVLISYYETGTCKRTEDVLLGEVKYEQKRMTKTIVRMLKEVAEYCPIMLVINRFHLASRSTIELINLLFDNPSEKIGIVLGANEARKNNENLLQYWEMLVERLKEEDQLYHIGGSEEANSNEPAHNAEEYENYTEIFTKLSNIIELLDYEQANNYFNYMEHQIKFEEVEMSNAVKFALYEMHVKVAILLEDISKALDLVKAITRLDVNGQEQMINFRCAYYMAMCHMYKDKLEDALGYAKMAKAEAEQIGDEELIFKAELLIVQVNMAGWHNIFFFLKDVAIEESLIEKMLKYNYKNNLAHVYIYAYDNRPEIVAKAYRSEAALKYFSKGVALAKELGNEQLVYDAYQKNIMMASANGMHEIALLYSVRSYQYIGEDDLQLLGRILSGVGYNLSALGRGKDALAFYNRAIRVFYQLELPEDIAEVCYNYALTQIAEGNYGDAERHMQLAMRVVEQLHLNSIRVCNLSKLYALLALLGILQGNRFDCERYLLSCSQFLDYLLEKQDEEAIHDFARSDDDMCLFLFAKALLEQSEGEYEEAFADIEKAKVHLKRSEGNLFFVTRLFHESCMKIFKQLGKKEMYESEKEDLVQYEEIMNDLGNSISYSLLDEIGYSSYSGEPMEEGVLDELIHKVGLEKENKQNKRQLQFISTWQDLLDETNASVSKMVKNGIQIFLNQFNVDCALYVRYYEGKPKLLYNDTGLFITEDELNVLEKNMKQHPQGFAISKISHTFSEHREVIKVFGADAVCSLVAVPFFKGGKLRSYLITYVKMKDNWHNSINRYMLNDDDLHMYRLLFMELGNAIKRLESYAQIYEMNKRLQSAATTDTLTGIYNRAGMYARLKTMEDDYKGVDSNKGVGVMFIDLDNFKPYNDAYGHDVGDLVLKGMANVFQKAIGDKGFLSRYGGDEFIIITYTNDRDELEQIAKNIYDGIEKADGFNKEIERLLGRKIEVAGQHKINCSIGIATAEQYEGEAAIERIITKADDSLYKVKEAGKGHYAFI